MVVARPHALAVGASGMLAGACRGLAERGWTVTLAARNLHRLRSASRGDPRVVPVPTDYRDSATFTAALTSAARVRGPITLALCWIRSDAPAALSASVAAVADGGRVLHVLGSAAVDPSTLGDKALLAGDRVRYQRVVLGFIVEDGWSRWLTDAEISAGALAAVDDPATDPYLVGQLHPWSARP